MKLYVFHDHTCSNILKAVNPFSSFRSLSTHVNELEFKTSFPVFILNLIKRNEMTTFSLCNFPYLEGKRDDAGGHASGPEDVII